MTDDQIPGFVENLRRDAATARKDYLSATAIQLDDAADLIEKLLGENQRLERTWVELPRNYIGRIKALERVLTEVYTRCHQPPRLDYETAHLIGVEIPDLIESVLEISCTVPDKTDDIPF